MEDPDATIPRPKLDPGSPGEREITPAEVRNLLAAGLGWKPLGRNAGSRGWEPPSLEVMQVALPQYEIESFIARGGMGAVYKGYQRSLKRAVAIKVLPPEADAGDLQFAERFKREAQAMARLSHPNVVPVFDAGETAEGYLYFVMEYVEGTDVAELLTTEERIDAPRTVAILGAVCEALAFAHEVGIVHRDIKPSNVMIDRRGRVMVADFGLAKMVNADDSLLTVSDMTLGTLDYSAPEARTPGGTPDGRADLYAVGVMLYQMLTGRIPRGRFDSPSGTVPEVDKRFDAIVDKAMQTDREKRYATAAELKRDLEAVLREGSADTLVRPDELGGTAATKKAGRSARAPVLAVGGLLAIVGLGAFFLTRSHEEDGGATLPTLAPTTRDPAVSAGWKDHLKATKWNAPWRVEKGVLKTTDIAAMSPALGTFRDGAVRIRTRALEKSDLQFQVFLRSGCPVAGNPGFTGAYKFQVNSNWRACTLTFLDRYQGQGDTEMSETLWRNHRFPADLSLDLEKEVEWEFRVVGDELSLLANGRLIRSARDARIGAGVVSITSDTGLAITGVETMNLGGPAVIPEAPASAPSPAIPPAPGPSITTATKEVPFTNSLGMKFVPLPIPSGPSAGKTVLFSVWETRVRDYGVMVTERARIQADPGFVQEPNHPAVMTSWWDAKAFCAWLTGRDRQAGLLGEGQRYRLPTDHEWSCAVGIGDREDPAKTLIEKDGKLADFPWGTGFPPPEGSGNYWSEELRPLVSAVSPGGTAGELPGYRDGHATTGPVGTYAANPFGLQDLDGNVSEWCNDGFDTSPGFGTLRGASWQDGGPGDLLSAKRERMRVAEVSNHVGFRCVLEVDDPSTPPGTGPRPSWGPLTPAADADPAR